MTGLGPRFHDREAFAPSRGWRLLPFRFGKLPHGGYVVTNDVGEYVVLHRDELEAAIRRTLDTRSASYRALKSRHFLFDEDSSCALDLLALKYRTRAERISRFTGLHIFVVTLRCDHTCGYCQVSRQTEDRAAYDMTIEDAERALDLTFRSPSPTIKIEFQGGEPLLNFDLVREIVLRAEAANRAASRDLQFVIASNLARLTPDILAFCKEHCVLLSTSLDGPRDLHDAHRRSRDGSSWELTIDGIRRARAALGPSGVGALMTMTPGALGRIEEIVDEYVRQGFESLFFRPISPYGFAVRTSLVRRYDAVNWLGAYRRGLRHVIDLNLRGTVIREEYTSILLGKMFAAGGTSYVDLQNPAGIGIGAVVFNYDGAVYASDEGRMLAEMGDTSFRLGHVRADSYESIFTSDALLGALEDSLLESVPGCTDCPYLPWCGADPVFHRATQGDVVGHKAFSEFCRRQMGMFEHLLELLENDAAARDVLLDWV